MRIKVGGKQFMAYVDAEVRRREMVRTPHIRTISINFVGRTVTVDGRSYGPLETEGFAIPALTDEHVLVVVE